MNACTKYGISPIFSIVSNTWRLMRTSWFEKSLADVKKSIFNQIRNSRTNKAAVSWTLKKATCRANLLRAPAQDEDIVAEL